jgi:hypothetical protein
LLEVTPWLFDGLFTELADPSTVFRSAACAQHHPQHVDL